MLKVITISEFQKNIYQHLENLPVVVTRKGLRAFIVNEYVPGQIGSVSQPVGNPTGALGTRTKSQIDRINDKTDELTRAELELPPEKIASEPAVPKPKSEKKQKLLSIGERCPHGLMYHEGCHHG